VVVSPAWRAPEVRSQVPRLRFRGSAAPQCVSLVAVCLAVLQGGAAAQTTRAQTAQLFAPPSDSDTDTNGKTKKPPRYEQFRRVSPKAQLGPPPNFERPPASGAGWTGFDSSNARKRTTKNKKQKPKSDDQSIAPGEAAAPPASPYQSGIPEAAKRALASGAPGTPPVELGPIEKPRKKRKAHVEPPDPYEQLGVHAGSFLLYPAIEFIIGRNSNPAQAPGGSPATTYTVAPEFRAQSEWSRHELKADLRGSYTGYTPDTTPTLSRPFFDGKVDGRVDVTRDTKIDLGARALVSTDNPGSPNLQADLAKLPVFTTYGGNAGLRHRFNRLEIGIKGDVERTVYTDSKLTDGTTASNEDRNYNQYGGTLRAGYELYPGVTPFVEGGIDTRKHDLNTDFFGYQRDSNGYVAKVGTTFEMSRLLTGEIAIGYAHRTYQDPRLDNLSGLIGNASLIWTATALTTVKFTASSTIGESSVPGVAGVLYRDAGVQIDHAFRRWLIGTVKFGIGLDTYKGGAVDSGSGTTEPLCDCVVSTPGGVSADREDKRYSVGVGLTYKVNRQLQFKGEARQEWLRSNVSGVDYTASIFLLGMRLQY
jgi:hypothetical protein